QGPSQRGHVRQISSAVILMAALGSTAMAQDAAQPSSSTQSAADKAAGSTPKEFKPLKYRSIGPAAGGRVARAAGVPGDPATYYLATASGGVWKSTDAGASWKPTFDDQPVSSIGSIAISPSNPGIVHVGS